MKKVLAKEEEDGSVTYKGKEKRVQGRLGIPEIPTSEW